MSISAGDKLGPYEILARIGAGGMGEVYSARDGRLNRFVAIKVSTAQFSERFEREAKAIAALNHPNICQIYDIGPNYLVMELVDGSPVVSEGQPTLPPKEVVRLAIQMAAALKAAHANGVIHRDLKPANILTTKGGVVKLLDFGLAKYTGDLDTTQDRTQSTSATQVGTILGTPAYMSPEQAEGKVADARSDIFSFGTVLYEMLAGRRAFGGGSASATMGAIILKNPDPLAAPPAVEAIVFKCLSKSPDGRFQSAAELLHALENVVTESNSVVVAPTLKWRALAIPVAVAALMIGAIGFGIYLHRSRTARIDSIAVLPLENRSNDSDADYISDGVTESINNSLARLPDLRVVPHSVVYSYKGKAMDIQKIGEALGVQAVLAGRMVQRGDDLTIGVELDDVRNGTQLWGQQYNRKLADLLAVQNDIAREVSQRLRLQLSAADQEKLTKGSTDNAQAYQLYLKGKYFTSKLSKDGFAKGIDYFNQAIAIDPNYGLAYNGLAFNYINQVDWFMSPNDAGPKAREAANRALAIDEGDADAHVSSAIVAHWYEWNWPLAEKEFKRAIELKPSDSEAHGYYSWFLAPMGRKDEALAEAKLSQQADPLSSLANFIVGSALVFTRQWEPAIEQLRGAQERDPTFWFAPSFLGRAYEQKGRLPEAIAEFQRALELEKYNPEIWSGLGHAYAQSGNRAEAQNVLVHLKELSAQTYVAPYNFAIIHAGLNENDQAFAYLNQAYADRSYYMAVYLTTDPRLDKLRSDPRFVELRRRVGLP
jgi:eukaryotic-like serine/threonine-protein kinase